MKFKVGHLIRFFDGPIYFVSNVDGGDYNLVDDKYRFNTHHIFTDQFYAIISDIFEEE